MTQTPNPFLRIHRGSTDENLNSADSKAADKAEAMDKTDQVESFWSSFESVTGWRVAPKSRRVGGAPSLVSSVETGTLDLPAELSMDAMVAAESIGTKAGASDAGSQSNDAFSAAEESYIDSLTNVSAVGKTAATELASSATGLIAELESVRSMLMRQQAELAARASVIACPDVQTTVADTLSIILADASEGCGCQAAALFTLDDDTSVLQTRAIHGLSTDRLTESPRSLKDARGDIEAMVKGVVLIDDLNAGPIDTWNAPESAAAAICCVVNAGDVPIGTIWFYAEETKHFGPAEAAVARLAALAIGNELKCDSYSPVQAQTATQNRQTKKSIRDVAEWQFQSLPIGAKLADDWKVDGMIESPSDFAVGWHMWDVLPDGSLVLAIAESVETDITGALNATVARSAFTAHAGYRHTPTQILSRISDTLWASSMGDQLVSMLYVRVDPDTGEGEISSAGHITAMIGSRYGYRPVVSGQSDPLCSHIDACSVNESFRIRPGETLLAYTPGMVSEKMSHTAIGGLLHDAMLQSDLSPLASIRRALASIPMLQERGAATLQRS